jgi:signal peptidase
MTAMVTPPLAAARAAASAKPVKKGVLHYIGTGISFGLLALVLMMAVLVIALPMVTKSTPYTVLTSSMTPSYPPGTLVIVKPIEASQIHLGDVITYQVKSGQAEVVTHRVVQIIEPSKPGETESFILKGDANSLPDAAPVKPVQIRGKVWYAVPFIGWVNNVINGNSRAMIVPVVAGVLFLYAGYMVASTVVDRRRKATLAARAAQYQAIDTELRELVDADKN